MKKLSHRSKDAAFVLNITSLMDIMTIVLIFLLMSFSTDENKVNPPDDFQLPVSTTERKGKLSVRVVISPAEIRVDDKVVASLRSGNFETQDLNKESLVMPVLQALKLWRTKARDRGDVVSLDGEDKEDDRDIVYFEAARGTPYRLIDQMMRTAASAGFVKFRLAVLRKA